MLRRNRQCGFSLIELMITVVISLIVVLGVIQLYLAIVTSSKATYERNRLTEEMRSLMAIMSRDIRRAGFWNANTGTADLWINPFTQAETDINVGSSSGEPTRSCIQYSYDIDLDGTVDADEYYSVRLQSGTVQIANEQLASCNTGSLGTEWRVATTPEITITDLDFTLSETCLDVETETEENCPCDSGNACQTIRSVDVVLEGNLTSDNSVTEKLFETIKIRNDKFECGSSC